MFFSLNVLALSSRYDKYNALLGYGVIGNTPVFGTGILGSSPSSPTTILVSRMVCISKYKASAFALAFVFSEDGRNL